MLLIPIAPDGLVVMNGWDSIKFWDTLSREEMTVIAICADSNSPLRKSPLSTRYELIAPSKLGKEYKKFRETEKFKKAFELYQTVDVDNLEKQRDILNSKLGEINKKLSEITLDDDTSLKNFDNLRKFQTNINKDLVIIEKSINERGMKEKKLSDAKLNGMEIFIKKVNDKEISKETIFRSR